MTTRRVFIKNSALCTASLALISPDFGRYRQEEFVAKRITDPAFTTWFGYYDKWQIDPTGRYALGCRVGFEDRSPVETDVLRIGIIDLTNSKWKEVGTSSAWGWQQGCMLQWVPGSKEEIIWNDRVGGRFVSHVYNMVSGKKRTLDKAIYALAPDGSFAIGTEFNRIQNLRPGYGYAGVPDPFEKVFAPKEIGLYKLDLKTGKSTLLISLNDMANVPFGNEDIKENLHWFNHLLVSPDSKRILFLHRWRKEIKDKQFMAGQGFTTRMITADSSGKDVYIMDPSGYTSHFIWKDPQHVMAWTKPVGKDWGFWLLKDKTQEISPVGQEVMKKNGHNTYVPNTNGNWVLNDAYPDENRNQILYLYHVPTRRQVLLGSFYSAPKYKGEWRCDLHPRCNQQGTKVYIDSTHEGIGRQMYEIDIKAIVG